MWKPPRTHFFVHPFLSFFSHRWPTTWGFLSGQASSMSGGFLIDETNVEDIQVLHRYSAFTARSSIQERAGQSHQKFDECRRFWLEFVGNLYLDNNCWVMPTHINGCAVWMIRQIRSHEFLCCCPMERKQMEVNAWCCFPPAPCLLCNVRPSFVSLGQRRPPCNDEPLLLWVTQTKYVETGGRFSPFEKNFIDWSEMFIFYLFQHNFWLNNYNFDLYFPFFLPRSSQQQRDTAHYKRRVWTVRPAKWGAWPSLSCGLSLKFLLLPVVAFTLRLGHAPVASIKTPLSIPSALAVRLCAAPAIQCQIVQSKGYGISISLRFDFNVELQCAFLGHSSFPTPNSSSSAFQHAKRMLQPFRRVRQYRAQMKHSQDQKCQSFRLIASLIFHWLILFRKREQMG